MKIRNIRILIKLRGIILFFGFVAAPFFCALSFFQLLESAGKFFKISHLPESAPDNLIYMIVQFLFFLALFFLFKLKFKKIINFISNENWFMSLGNALIPAIKAFALGLAVTFFITVIFEFILQIESLKKWLYTPNYGFELMYDYLKNFNHIKIIILFFFIVVLAPIYEEIIFRGFLQDSFGKFFKKNNLDVILTALIFSLFHINSLSNAAFAFTVGIILSNVRKRTKSINTTIWIHSIINFFGLITGLLYFYLKLRI
jgi:membrane protease YdiL (CAAX protease family)